MINHAEQLATALRDTLRSLEISTEYTTARNPAALRECIAPALAALAAYAAQRERHPDTDAFMAAADGALDSDYYQMTDEPIDRVEDGAWVTVRMFVTNEEAGLSTGEED